MCPSIPGPENSASGDKMYQKIKEMPIYKRVTTNSTVMGTNFMSLIRRVHFLWLLVPPALMLTLWVLIWTGILSFDVDAMERLALVLTSLFMVTVVVRFAISRHRFFLWGAGLMGVIFCREIHFQGTDFGIYLGLVLLLGIALLKYDALEDYLANPLVINLFVIGLFTYFLAQSIDQRWWKGLLGEEVVFVPLEETMEVMGHCFIGTALLFAKILNKKMIIPRS